MHSESGDDGDDDEPVRERWDDSDRDSSSTGLRKIHVQPRSLRAAWGGRSSMADRTAWPPFCHV